MISFAYTETQRSKNRCVKDQIDEKYLTMFSFFVLGGSLLWCNGRDSGRQYNNVGSHLLSNYFVQKNQRLGLSLVQPSQHWIVTRSFFFEGSVTARKG